MSRSIHVTSLLVLAACGTQEPDSPDAMASSMVHASGGVFDETAAPVVGMAICVLDRPDLACTETEAPLGSASGTVRIRIELGRTTVVGFACEVP